MDTLRGIKNYMRLFGIGSNLVLFLEVFMQIYMNLMANGEDVKYYQKII